MSASGRIPSRTLLSCCKKLVHCRQAGYRTVVLGISKMLAHLEKKCDSSRHPFRDGSWVLQNFVHCSCQEEPEVLQLVWIRGFPFLCSFDDSEHVRESKLSPCLRCYSLVCFLLILDPQCFLFMLSIILNDAAPECLNSWL